MMGTKLWLSVCTVTMHVAILMLITSKGVVNAQEVRIKTVSGAIELEPFSKIYSCFPSDVVVRPGKNYSATLTGEPSVITALSFSVQNDTLYLSVNKEIETSELLRATITMPKDSLETLTVLNSGNLYLEKGFLLQSLSINTDSGGNINMPDVDLESVAITASNGGFIYLSKTKDAKVILSVGANVNLVATGRIETRLSSGANLLVDGSQDTIISGSGYNGAKIIYTEGVCGVQSSNIGEEICEKVPEIGFPSQFVESTPFITVRSVIMCGLEY